MTKSGIVLRKKYAIATSSPMNTVSVACMYTHTHTHTHTHARTHTHTHTHIHTHTHFVSTIPCSPSPSVVLGRAASPDTKQPTLNRTFQKRVKMKTVRLFPAKKREPAPKAVEGTVDQRTSPSSSILPGSLGKQVKERQRASWKRGPVWIKWMNPFPNPFQN